MPNKELRCQTSVRIYGEEKCFGPGVAELLERVDQLRSLRKATIEMDMAYSKAWKIVKIAEENLGFPLLVSVTGGKIDKPSFAKQMYPPADRENIGAYIVPGLQNVYCKLRKVGDADLDIEVSGVAQEHSILHAHKVFSADDLCVSRNCYEDIAYL